MSDGVAVVGDGWPVTGRRPQTGRLKRHAVLPGPTPARRAAPGAHPAAGLGFLEYFDTVYVPHTVRTVKGTTTGQYRSYAVAIDRELARVAAGPAKVTVAAATTQQLLTALAAAAATGGSSRRKKLHIVAGKVFHLAATSSPALRADNPMSSVKDPTPKAPLVNLLDGRNPAPPVVEHQATFRDARREVTFWDVITEILPNLAKHYHPHVWMRLIAGPRPFELSDFTEEHFHLAEGYAVAATSLTLQNPLHNGGQRLMEGPLKARTINDERIIPLPDIPEFRAALQSAIDTVAARAATRREHLTSGRARSRSANADHDAWLASELMFTERPRVFTTENGAPLDTTNFDRIWKKAVHAAFPDEGDPRRALRFYDLREIAGDAMKGAGVSVTEASLLLGHSERVHRRSYTERRIDEVTRTSKLMTEHLLATRDGEPEPLAAVIDFPASA